MPLFEIYEKKNKTFNTDDMPLIEKIMKFFVKDYKHKLFDSHLGK